MVLTLIATSASVLLREMERNYEQTAPASATLEVSRPPSQADLEGVRSLAGVIDARGGQTLRLRVQDGEGHWQPLLVFVSPDLGASTIATVAPVSGPWPPLTGTLALERTALPTFGWAPGQRLQAKTEDGRALTLTLGTVVHDPAVAPAYQERTAYAYAEPATLEAWGLGRLDEIKFRTEANLSTAQVKDLAGRVAQALDDSGNVVTAAQVPPVHRHPHQSILTTLLVIFGIFGLMTVVLSSLLAANTAAAYWARETKTIGILKTLGIPPLALLALVLAPLALTGLAATLVGVPIGALMAPSLTNALAQLLNFSLASQAPAWLAWVGPLVLGLALPLVLSWPAAQGTLKAPVVDALNHQGTNATHYEKKSAASSRFPLLAMTLRNAVRRRGRLVLSLALTGLGGALFLTAGNLALSWNTGLDSSMAHRHADVDLRLNQKPTPASLLHLATALPGSNTELWPSLPATLPSTSGLAIELTYPDQAHGSLRAVGVPASTTMISFPAREGVRFPGPGEVVLNDAARARFGAPVLGNPVTMVLAGAVRTYRLAGWVKEFGPATAYLLPEDEAFTGTDPDQRWNLMVDAPGTERSPLQTTLTRWTEDEGIGLEVMIDTEEFRVAGTEHFALLIDLIRLMGLVTGAVGWLGVSSQMGLAVVERRRELGILRTLGATPGAITASLLAEAAVLLTAGFGVAVGVALPLSAGLGNFLGTLSFQAPLDLVFDVPTGLFWLALSLAGGLAACLSPALTAGRLAVRETLT